MSALLKNTTHHFLGLSSLKRLFSVNVTKPSRAVKLSFSVFENSNAAAKQLTPLFLLHGLFGSKKNFESIAKYLSQTGRKVITVDARNHGDSAHSSEMNYHVMSEDMEFLLNDLSLKSAIFLGHSMGGKIAMTLALSKPHLVDMLIVEDICPATSRSKEVNLFPKYIDAMQKVTFGPDVKTLTQARQTANKQLMDTFTDKPQRDFILTNVDLRNDRFTWRVNLDAISNSLNDVLEFPHFSSPYYGRTAFIGGSNSNLISQPDLPEIHRLFPKASVQYIGGAGHWVHSDKPHEFIKVVQQLLDSYEESKGALGTEFNQ